MSRQKLRIHNTEKDNLIFNLRAEVGEIITSWVLYKKVTVAKGNKGSLIIVLDSQTVCLLARRLEYDIIARLSELAEKKIGRLNFYFASIKMEALYNEVDNFIKYIQKNRLDEKRNLDISHKELPEKWSDHKYFYIGNGIIYVA